MQTFKTYVQNFPTTKADLRIYRESISAKGALLLACQMYATYVQEVNTSADTTVECIIFLQFYKMLLSGKAYIDQETAGKDVYADTELEEFIILAHMAAYIVPRAPALRVDAAGTESISLLTHAFDNYFEQYTFQILQLARPLVLTKISEFRFR